MRLSIKAQEKLQNPAGRGGRHQEMCSLMPSLLNAGLAPEAVFVHCKATYGGPDMPDSEIRSILEWAVKFVRDHTPISGARSAVYNVDQRYSHAARQSAAEIAKAVSIEQAIENAEKFLGGFKATPQALYDASPIKPSSNWRDDSILAFRALYHPDEFICVNTDFQLITHKDGTQKASICGPGVTRTAKGWITFITKYGAPERKAGAWFRMNPVSQVGTGHSGAHRDDDIIVYRFILVEFDQISLELQLSLLASLAWPVSMIISSGGRSHHGLVLANCQTRREYDEKAEWIYSHLAKFKIDTSNRNPSRYSRLPGCHRQVGATGQGIQRIFYLNRNPQDGPILS